MIHCDIVTKQDDIFQYKEIWNKLFESGEYEVSTSFEWTQALLKTHLKENDLFVLMVLRKSEEIFGILPLILRETKKYGQSIRNLFPISEYYNTHSDILLKYPSGESTQEIINSLFNLKYKWDIFRIGRFVETNPIIECIETNLKNNSIRYKIKKEEPSFIIRLDDSYNVYLKKRSGKFRNYLKRMQKKLSALGCVKIVRIEDFDSMLDAYEQLLYVERKSWKHNHGTAISNIKKQEAFYRKLCEGEFKTRRLHLLFLYLNDLPVAYNLGLIKNNNYLYLKTSFVEEFKKASPATVLRADLIEELISIGIEHFDFPGEPYEWEQQWANDIQWHKSIIIYNNTLKAKLFSVYNTSKIILRNHNNEDKFLYHNSFDVKPKKN